MPDPNPRPLDHLLLGGDPHAPALVNKAETLSRADAEAAVGALAAALAGFGLNPGSRVATWLPKTVEACLMPLAAPRAGLVHVPINPVLRRAQVAHILNDCDASLLLTSATRRASLLPGDVPVGCAIWNEDDAIAARAQAARFGPSKAAPDALAAILYTSGSTGRPKGVMLSHANLWLGAVSVAHYLALGPDDVVLAVLPLGFDYGQNQLFSAWKARASVVPFDYLLPRDVIRAVAQHEVTKLAAVPPLWLQLVEQDWGAAGTRLNRVTNSGGALTPSLIARMRASFPNADIVPMYGLTEAFRSTYLPPELVRDHPTSMGRAIPFADIHVLRADGTEADDGEPGELVHAGPLVAQGYWRDPERTAARFRPFRGGTAVWSGDTVTRDAQGLLYFVGREDEMIKTSGHRVSPAEIEEAALASGQAVEAVAHGVEDARLGQSIRLVVRGTGDEATLGAHLKSELPTYMHPRTIEWRDALPQNANGKIDRAAIRAEVKS
ncbi:MAG: acyl-CoA ligase (AMP-forming), exosortase A system-associated [Sphingomonadaceae bacterium]